MSTATLVITRNRNKLTVRLIPGDADEETMAIAMAALKAARLAIEARDKSVEPKR
jgi:hypothetical protein